MVVTFPFEQEFLLPDSDKRNEKNEHVNEHVNRQTKILSILKKNPSLTLEQLAKNTSISMATLRRDMKILKEMNYIKRIGSDKSGYWEVLD